MLGCTLGVTLGGQQKHVSSPPAIQQQCLAGLCPAACSLSSVISLSFQFGRSVSFCDSDSDSVPGELGQPWWEGGGRSYRYAFGFTRSLKKPLTRGLFAPCEQVGTGRHRLPQFSLFSLPLPLHPLSDRAASLGAAVGVSGIAHGGLSPCSIHCSPEWGSYSPSLL